MITCYLASNSALSLLLLSVQEKDKNRKLLALRLCVASPVLDLVSLILVLC